MSLGLQGKLQRVENISRHVEYEPQNKIIKNKI